MEWGQASCKPSSYIWMQYNAHVPKFERNKLDYKTRKCVLLGYGTSQKGYCLYNIECMKVVHSRDVVFDEISTPRIWKDYSQVC